MAFAGTAAPVGTSTFLESLPEDARLLCLFDWERYLLACGRLHESLDVLYLHNEKRKKWGNWLYAALGELQVAEVSLLLNDLKNALASTDIAIQLTERTASAGLWRDAQAYRARINFLRGDTESAQTQFDTSIPDILVGIDFRLPVEWKALLFSRKGMFKDAESLLNRKRSLMENAQGETRYRALCDLCTIEVALASGNVHVDPDLIQTAKAWAEANDAKESLCTLSLIMARLQLVRYRAASNDLKSTYLTEAFAKLDDSLRIALDCGYVCSVLIRFYAGQKRNCWLDIRWTRKTMLNWHFTGRSIGHVHVVTKAMYGVDLSAPNSSKDQHRR
jgi:ATP/maltotriose-dependent transcriptional regulator MalT